MSLADQIRETGFFDENDPQENGTISFPMRDRPDGATIYVPANDREFAIRQAAIAHFLNAQPLQEFIDRLDPSDRRVNRPSDPYYVIPAQHLPDVLAIIRPLRNHPMTDDELFALATKINRIECSMTSLHSFINDEEVRRPILARMYADLVPLRAQLDAALGLGNADIADNLPQP